MVLIFPDGERSYYLDGMEVTNAMLYRKFVFEAIRAVESMIEIVLTEATGMTPPLWIGVKQTFLTTSNLRK